MTKAQLFNKTRFPVTAAIGFNVPVIENSLSLDNYTDSSLLTFVVGLVSLYTLQFSILHLHIYMYDTVSTYLSLPCKMLHSYCSD